MPPEEIEPPPGCVAGEKPLADGGCLQPGVPLDGCAEGFVAEGEGCAPVLPARACETAAMAVPGDTTCREVAACGRAPWGDRPIDENMIFVDASYTQSDADGTVSRPFATITQAVTAAPTNGVVMIAQGLYQEVVVIEDKVLELRGRCPELVTIEGVDPGAGAVLVTGADGSRIRQLGITGVGSGVLVSGALDVELDRVWIHDIVGLGVAASDAWGPASIAIRDSLVESITYYLAVGAENTDLTLERTVVRGTRPLGDQGGRGIDIGTVSGHATAHLVVSASVIEDNRDAGVVMGAGEAQLEATVIRGTRPSFRGGSGGVGLVLQAEPDGATASGVLRTSVLDDNTHVAVGVLGGALDMASTVIKNTQPSSDVGGRGLHIQPASSGERSSSVVRSSLFEHCREAGIAAIGSDLDAESLLVRDTETSAAGHGVGIMLGDDRGTITGTPIAAAGAVRWSRIERSHLMGLGIVGSSATVEGVAVDTISPSGPFMGDGILVLGGGVPAEADIRTSDVRGGTRAGIADFAARVFVGGSRLECNAIDLAGEPVDLVPFELEDHGGNHCGCGGESWPCKVFTTMLAPPPVLEP